MENTRKSADLNASDNTSISDGSSLRLRARYLLEKQQIQAEFGDLKQILETLGVSQRRACQLLLVDPSAWTRWNKTEAPPHIYQALKWLIQLKKINPDIIGPTDISNRLDYIQSSTQGKIRELERSLNLLERSMVIAAAHRIPAAAPSAAPNSQQENSDQEKVDFQKQERRLLKKIALLEGKIRDLQVVKAKVAKRPKKKMKYLITPKPKKKVSKRIAKKSKRKPKIQKKSRRSASRKKSAKK
jgi:hypothetical protein